MNIFNDFELLDFCNLDVMMWGEEGGNSVRIPCAHLVVSAHAPFIPIAHIATGHLVLSAHAPTYSIRHSVATGHLVLSAHAPSVNKRYWIAKQGGIFHDAANWSITSGGTGGASIPAAGDVAIFDANSFSGPQYTVICFESILCAIHISGSEKFALKLRHGSISLQEDLVGLSSFSLMGSGTSLTTNDYCITVLTAFVCTCYDSDSDNPTMNLGSSVITIGDSSSYNAGGLDFRQYCTINASAATFNIPTDGGYVINYGYTIGTLNIIRPGVTSSGVFNFEQSGTYNNLSITGDGDVTFSGRSIQAKDTEGADTITVGNLTLQGQTTGGLVLRPYTGEWGDATAWNLSKPSGEVSAVNCTIKGSAASGGATFKAFLFYGNVDGGGNTGWYFGAAAPGIRYWVEGGTGGNGSWTETTHWSETSGGSGGASYPTSASYTAIFDENSFSASAKNVIIQGVVVNCHIITTDALPFQIMIDTDESPGDSSLTLHEDLHIYYLQINDTFNFNGFDVFVEGINIADTGIVTIGSSSIEIETAGVYDAPEFGVGSAADVDFTDSNIIFHCFDSAGNFSGGGHTLGAVDIKMDGQFSLKEDTSVDALSFAGDGEVILGDYEVDITLTTISELQMTGDTPGGLIVGAYTESDPEYTGNATFSSNGTVDVDNCTISNSTATGGATFNALTRDGNFDGGGNTGWYFGVDVFVPVAHLTLAAHAPAWGDVSRSVPQASMTLTAYAPGLQYSNSVPAGHLTLAAHAPAWGVHAVTVNKAGLVLAAHPPYLVPTVIQDIPAAHLALAVHAPAWGEVSRSIPLASMTLAAYAPGLQCSNSVPVSHLALAAHAPAWGVHAVTVNKTGLVLAARPPYLTPTVIQDIPAGHIVLAAYAPVWGEVSISVPLASMALTAHRPYQSWAISANRLATLQNIYLCVLTGAADGVADLMIPISSFQSTMRDGDPSYLSCVIPNSVDYVAAIAARPNGDIVIRKGYKFSDGTMQTEEICRVDYENLQIFRGAHSDSAILSGHRTITSTDSKSVTLANVSYYGLQANGKRTFRADPDLFLRVGDTAVYGAESIVVDQINYTVGDRQAIMQVTEA